MYNATATLNTSSQEPNQILELSYKFKKGFCLDNLKKYKRENLGKKKDEGDYTSLEYVSSCSRAKDTS